MYVPKAGQLTALSLMKSSKLDDMQKLSAITGMLVSLFPTEDDKSWFVEQLASGDYELDDMITTVQMVIGAAAPKEETKAEPLPTAAELL